MRNNFVGILILFFSIFSYFLYVAIYADNASKARHRMKTITDDFIKENNHLKSENKQKDQIKDSETINILLWTARYPGDKALNWWGYNADSTFKGCPVSNCRLVDRIKQSHAVMISRFQYVTFPKYRHPDQKWVFFTRESPSHRPIPQSAHRLFNVTFTYSEKSDIVIPYGKTAAITATTNSSGIITNKDNKKRWQNKKLVAWAVSNCNPTSQRGVYVKELEKYLDVAIYGKCGNLECPPGEKDECIIAAAKQYKFYLSFENSLCVDYITEKTWNALKYGIVPVVYGYANYTKYLPPNSFIDVRDFKSPKHLATYLKYLSHNKGAYDRYKKWRENYYVYDSFQESRCDLCQYLHNTRHVKDKIVNLEKFWTAERNCFDSSIMLQSLGVIAK